ncbi:helicase associated domain-containing protein [Micromonospora sp. NPDC000207]|uniref:helicase associated domain-containing protein n=1 Tax=Micromonospora sp. NPDC000207 TaxID=3154246 RepID=UPI00332AC51F
MHPRDSEVLAESLRTGAARAADATEVGGLLSDLSREQVRRVAEVLADGIADDMAARFPGFDRSAWMATLRLSADASALPDYAPTAARADFAPLAFDDVQVGDWIRYAKSAHHPIIGRVRSRTNSVVVTEDERAAYPSTGRRRKSSELPRHLWDQLGVTLEPVEAGGERREETGRPEGGRAVSRRQAPVVAMEAARLYLARHGDLRAPTAHIEDGYRLGKFLSDQRYEYRRAILNADRLRDLDALDVSWRHGCEWGERR